MKRKEFENKGIIKLNMPLQNQGVIDVAINVHLACF